MGNKNQIFQVYDFFKRILNAFGVCETMYNARDKKDLFGDIWLASKDRMTTLSLVEIALVSFFDKEISSCLIEKRCIIDISS